MSDNPAPPAAWLVAVPWDWDDRDRQLRYDGTFIGLANREEVVAERRRQTKGRQDAAVDADSIRYDRFEVAPRHAAPSAFAPDWVATGGLGVLATPRLFALLDQPDGLQAIPAEVHWSGPDAPDLSYVWVTAIPHVPTIDPDASQAKFRTRERAGALVVELAWQFGAVLRLRTGLQPPTGLFRASEDRSLLFATDAVARAVVRAGCTGIEFLHPETAFAQGNPTHRLGPNGMELHPEEAARRAGTPISRLNPDVPFPFVPPPPGPVVRWGFSPADLLDWCDADTELRVHPRPDLGDLDTHAFLLAGLLCVGIGNSQRLMRKVLDALAAVRAGQMECWVGELIEHDTVAIRPDAMWVHHGHAYPGGDMRAFPLDGIEDVLQRWLETVRRYDDDET